MGLLKNILGAIFGFISSLLRRVGLGKKSEYFLELDNSLTAPSPESPPPVTLAPTTDAPAEGVIAPTTTTATPALATLTESAPAPTPAPAAAPKPKPIDVNFAPDYLTSPAIAGQRRRPGANMGDFLLLAKQAKTPRG